MGTILPLRVCFLWHQHQPDYRVDGRFVLPWVRLHALKDYADLTRTLTAHSLPHTINVVPALLSQLDDIAAGMHDPITELCFPDPEALTDDQRGSLAQWATTIQRQTMVKPLVRYDELFDVLVSGDIRTLNNQDWLDVQVLIHLAWLGPWARSTPTAQYLILKGRDFTKADKQQLFVLCNEVISSVVPLLHAAQQRGAIEVSVTPYDHPILPLLVNTDVAHTCMPGIELPTPSFSAPDHAWRQVRNALTEWQRRTGVVPRGMWPAEGSISQDALNIMSSCGVEWAASDQDVLRRSLGVDAGETDHFFAHQVHTATGVLSMLFRDHELSDAIGFSYSSWDASDAAKDFVRRLEQRRALIVSLEGEQALRYAVVPIILDGENCWEFYHDNGKVFLDRLMEELASNPRISCVTCGQAARQPARTLHSVYPGSWIDANFGVWIGSPAKNEAWSLLRETRSVLERNGHSPDYVANTMSALEASDWFWWYDERHQAPHKAMFDVIFRKRVEDVFVLCGERPPERCLRPLSEVHMNETHPRVPIVFGTAAMHRSQALARDVTLDVHEDWNRLTLNLQRPLEGIEEITVQIFGQDGLERACLITSDEVLWRSPHHDEGFESLGGNAVAFYLHAHRSWSLKVREQRAGTESISAVVTVNSAG